MGRFIKELRYSLGLKRHIFFIILICFVVCGAAWLFQDTLTAELEKAFPTKYAQEKTPTIAEQRHVSGTVAQKNPAVTDSDLKAELQYNEQLKKAEWIKDYREIATEYVAVQSFLGPDSAVKGYLTDAFHNNKDVDSEGAKYTTVNTIWMEESLAKEFHLGQEAVQIFRMPNDYLSKIYVVLGAEYKMDGGYQVGNILKTKKNTTEGVQNMVVVGFLEPGATAKIGEEEINLDSYILCPFISLADIYEIKEEEPGSYTDGIFIQDALITEEMKSVYRNNPAVKKNETKSGVMYGEVKALYIERAALEGENIPTWLKSLANKAEKETYSRAVIGATYVDSGKFVLGEDFDILINKTLSKARTVDVLPAGATWTVYGMEIELDDYIVFLQEPKKEEEKQTEDQAGDNPGDDEPVLIDEPFGPKEREFKADERLKLFHYQHMMNCGYFTTTLTEDEAQEQLLVLLDEAWKDFRRDNPGKNPLSTYKIEGADPSNSILYRENAPKLSQRIIKLTKYGFFFGMLLFAAYLFFKFWRGKEYYSSLYMTGTNRTEMAVLYLIEGVLMAVLAAALSVGIAFAITKLLQLQMTDYKPLVKRFFRLTGYPTAAIIIWILVRDFGRMFRRTEEV